MLIYMVDNVRFETRAQAQQYVKDFGGTYKEMTLQPYKPVAHNPGYRERRAYVIIARAVHEGIFADEQTKEYFMSFAHRVSGSLEDFDSHRTSLDGSLAIFETTLWFDEGVNDGDLDGDVLLDQWKDAGYIADWFYWKITEDERNEGYQSIHDYLTLNSAAWEAEVQE